AKPEKNQRSWACDGRAEQKNPRVNSPNTIHLTYQKLGGQFVPTELVEKNQIGKRPAERLDVCVGAGSFENGLAVGVLGYDDPYIFRSSSQNIVQVFELCTVFYESVEGKCIRGLQWKKAKSLKVIAKVLGAKRIKRIERNCHLRAKC